MGLDTMIRLPGQNPCTVTHSLSTMGGDERTWLPGKTLLHCHSHSVGHGMRCGQTAEMTTLLLTSCLSCVNTWLIRLPGRKPLEFHSQPVGHRKRCNETAWLKIAALSHTSCLSWNVMSSDSLADNHTLSLTSCWSWDEMDKTAWQRITEIPLTNCWSWDVMWYDYLEESHWSTTHQLCIVG